MSSSHGFWLPVEQVMQRAQDKSFKGFKLAEVTKCHFHNILLLTQVHNYQCGKSLHNSWIPGGKRYRTPSRRLAITLYLNKFYYLRFIFWAKAHYLKQIKYEKSKYINKRNNDLKLLHKNLSLFRRMSLHCKHSRFSGLPL